MFSLKYERTFPANPNVYNAFILKVITGVRYGEPCKNGMPIFLVSVFV